MRTGLPPDIAGRSSTVHYPQTTAEQITDHIARKRAETETDALPVSRRSLVVVPRDTGALLGAITWAWESEETDPAST